MKNFRLFLRRKKKKDKSSIIYRKGENGKATVAMFSDFFSNLTDDLFCTNTMYSDLKDSILSTIDVYSPKLELTLDIYEREVSDEDKRNFAEMGFKRYINACYRKAWLAFINQLLQVFFFAFVGVGFIYVGYLLGDREIIAEWFSYVIINIGSVLLWQLAGYWAFEYTDQKKELDRLKQVANLNFVFKKWE